MLVELAVSDHVERCLTAPKETSRVPPRLPKKGWEVNHRTEASRMGSWSGSGTPSKKLPARPCEEGAMSRVPDKKTT